MRNGLVVLGAAVLIMTLPVAGQTPGDVPPRGGLGTAAAEDGPNGASQVRGAKGDHQRSYYFEAAGLEMPYRIYVPESYDAAVGAPLIVALHGFGGDQNYFFGAVDELAALCEQYGFLFVAPMGLAEDGWFGAPLEIPGNAPRSSGAAPPPQTRSPDEERQHRALSETDVLNVIDIVRAEYNIDPDRIYLMGHSMGGFGTWWLGQKHAELWSAIAPMSGVLPGVDYRLPRLRGVPAHVSIGAEENPAWVDASRQQVAAMRAMGMTVEYVEPAGATHTSMIAPTVPGIFEFFSRHEKAEDAPSE